MWRDFTPEQVRKLRYALIFAIVLVLIDVCLIGTLLYLGVLEVPPLFP